MGNKKNLLYTAFILVFASLTISLLYFSFFKPLFQDEGVFLTISQGILDGKVPYRDFFDHKPPGIYFLLTPIVDIFGRNIWAFKSFLFLNNFVAAFLVFLIANKMKKGCGILASILFLFTATFFETNYLIAEPFMTTFLLVAVYFWSRSNLDQESTLYKKHLLLSGLMIGLAMLMKQTAVVNFLILAYFIYREDKNNILKYFAGAVLPWVPVIIYLLANNIFREAWNQIVLVNLTSYPREPILYVVKYLSGTFKQTLPVWILFLFGIFNLKTYLKSNNLEKILLPSIILPIPFFLIRHYPHYWLQIVPFVSILAGIQLYKLLHPKGVMTLTPTPLGCNTAIRIFVLVLVTLSLYSNLRWFYWITKYQNGPKLKEQTEAANYIKNLPQENLLAENQFTTFYFLTDKEPLTKYLYITEVNSPENSEQITIEKLEQNPNTIILWPKNNEYAFAKKLQEYIIKNYESVKEFENLGLVVFMTRQ